MESNGYQDQFGEFNWIISASGKKGFEVLSPENTCWSNLTDWLSEDHGEFIPGFLSYDLKNSIENIDLKQTDESGFPYMAFFPSDWFIGENRKGEFLNRNLPPGILMEAQKNLHHKISKKLPSIKIQHRISRDEYIRNFHKIQDHLRGGDIYEINYCQEFSLINKSLDPIDLFGRLNRHSPSPFACLLKYESSWLISSSPERYLRKKNNKIISQPIKGTCRRTGKPSMDIIEAEKLKNSPKERSENIMIVDLVRNDLSKCCLPGSVRVNELCGIYPFSGLQHMISTIEGNLKNADDMISPIIATFPMGSMTGAPKISAMTISEKLENFQRKMYSGAFGYFDHQGNFDFNVLIRSFVWNQKNGVLSFSSGSAITALSNPEEEYKECMLKIENLLKSLSEE